MYQKLLLNCDGGIIDASQQSEQDNCAVIAIGLGGTGVDCLKNLKAKVYNRVRPDNPDKDKSVHQYAHIKFLAIDTDKTGMENSNKDSADISKINMDTEFFDISYSGDITKMLRENSAALSTKPEYKEWFAFEDIKVLTAKAGAGGVRQLGRYLFMEKAQTFVTKIRNLITQAKMDLNEPKVYIHIFSGMGGGTGAGTFLDVCYLVREALSLEGTNAFTCGYFFLPDVNLANNLNSQTAAYVKVNGYAAMQELDYCMNFENNGDKWSQRYTGMNPVESTYPPVDICHLVSAKDSAGNDIPKAYDYAMNVVTDYFMDFLVKTDAEFTMESHISNFVKMKDQLNKQYGAQYEYCVLGASNATLPFKEVLTYLASKMFENFEDINTALPTKGNVEEFIAKNGLKYDNLFNQLIQNCDMSFPRPDVKWKDAKTNDELTTTWFTDHRSRVENALDKNFSIMKRDLDNYNSVSEGQTGNTRSVIGKIYNSLRTFMIDPDKGPFFAAAVLRSTLGGDLIAVIDGHLAEVKSKYGQESAQEEKMEREREQSQRDFFENSGIMNGGKKYEVYRDKTRALAIHYTRLVIFSKMEDFLNILRRQLTDLADNFTDVFKNTISDLINTFNANRDYLENIANNVSVYEYPLIKIDDMKDSLQSVIKDMNIKDKIKDFLTNMLSSESIKAWSSSDENQIANVVTYYFTKLFDTYSKKTMTGYLQEKYNTTNTDQLIKKIREDIMSQLDSKANPMFWTSSLYDINSAAKIGYISIPETCEEVVLAAENLRTSRTELSVRKTALKDRISIMRCLVGTPMYGYQGLLQYENNSVNDTAVGKHIYEGHQYTHADGNTVKGRDWRELPSPSAFSIMNIQNNEILRKNAEKAKDLYIKAEELGIIGQTGPNEFGIKIISESFINEIRTTHLSTENKSVDDKIEASNKIMKMKQNIEYNAVSVKIMNDGSATMPEMNRRIVRIDHFAAAPKYHELVSIEINKLNEIDKILDLLEIKVDHDFEDFLSAIFTGAINLNIPEIEYEDDFGEKIILSSPNMEKGGIPLYQAYFNFKKLDYDVRLKMKNIAEQRCKAPIAAAVQQSCKNINEEMKNVKNMLDEARAEFPKEIIEVKDFLTKIRDSLTRFINKYRINLDQ